MVESLKPGTSYKFLGVQETVTQDEKLALECAAKVYLRRLSVIWSSPLSDINRVRASNQYAMPVLIYLMWTHTGQSQNCELLTEKLERSSVKTVGSIP